MTLHALWCHPRSVSTAFERVMRERGDLAVLHEPFMYHYYLTTTDRLFPDFSPEPGHPTTYHDIREMIRRKARSGPVFFKDMAYYVVDALTEDAGFAAETTHAFLVRDPFEAALSYARRDPNFSRRELGHEAQHHLFEALTKLGYSPLVLTADQLRQDPQGTLRRYWAHVGLPFVDHAFEWDSRVPEDWKAVAGWHTEVLESSVITQPEDADARAQLAAFGACAPFSGYAAHHAPFYDALKEIAEKQAHQK